MNTCSLSVTINSATAQKNARFSPLSFHWRSLYFFVVVIYPVSIWRRNCSPPVREFFSAWKGWFRFFLLASEHHDHYLVLIGRNEPANDLMTYPKNDGCPVPKARAWLCFFRTANVLLSPGLVLEGGKNSAVIDWIKVSSWETKTHLRSVRRIFRCGSNYKPVFLRHEEDNKMFFSLSSFLSFFAWWSVWEKPFSHFPLFSLTHSTAKHGIENKLLFSWGEKRWKK